MSRSKKGAAAAAAAAASIPSAAAAAGSQVLDDDDDGLEPDGVGGQKGVSSFISKIYKMVSDPTTQDIVCWNERGDGFLVKNEFVFASQIMRSYFRHQNFSSFVRQLNFYGFHKRSSPSSLTSFYHPSFRKGHPELLCQILRKSPETKDAGLRDLVTNLTSEVAELRQQNEDLFKIQQRILYIFSRYMRASQGVGVGSGGASGISGGGAVGVQEGGSAAKRLREARVGAVDPSKRQRLLMEAKPDSPPTHTTEYHSDTYSLSSPQQNRAGGEYSNGSSRGGAAAAAASSAGVISPDSGVLDLNTDQYHASGVHSSGPYGAHSLSNLDWSSDPAAAIQDLMTSLPASAKHVLNSSTPLPMQLSRAGSNGVVNAAQQGQPFIMDAGGFAFPPRGSDLALVGGGRGGRTAVSARGGASAANANLLDISSQLASSNPKQLLEMLDRMGADQPMGGPAGGSAQSIQGVFEDADILSTQQSNNSRRNAAGANRAQNSSGRQQQHQQQMQSRTDGGFAGAAAAAAYSAPRRSSGAKLSPIDDNSSTDLHEHANLHLGAPVPVSPVDAFPLGASGYPQPPQQQRQPSDSDADPSLDTHGYVDNSNYALLQSPSLPMPDLSRGLSTGLGGLDAPSGGAPDLSASFYASPFHAPLPPPANTASTGIEALMPLTPTHGALSAPPSPSPYAQ